MGIAIELVCPDGETTRGIFADYGTPIDAAGFMAVKIGKTIYPLTKRYVTVVEHGGEYEVADADSLDTPAPPP